jgi:hypothetical protein
MFGADYKLRRCSAVSCTPLTTPLWNTLNLCCFPTPCFMQGRRFIAYTVAC